MDWSFLAWLAAIAWLAPTLILLIAFWLMGDEPGGPDWWMAPLWPAVVVVLALSGARDRLRRLLGFP